MSFVPVPLCAILTRLEREARGGTLFGDAPEGWWRPSIRDLSASLFGHRTGNPFGPAAGPHTQLAPNLVRCWLAGGRFLELRTVQARAATGVPRPSIRLRDAGYNVELSQELSPRDALLEYAKAATLISILDHEDGFGMLHAHRGRETVFDASVGNDLEGLRSAPMREYLRGLKEPGALYDALRRELTGPLARFRDMVPHRALADTVTLSTFRGCRPAEIEAIVRTLVEEHGFSVVLKLNPTLLGRRKVAEVLHERLGFTHLSLLPQVFDGDLKYGPAVSLVRRLAEVARSAGKGFGVKLTNTLAVAADPRMFPAAAGGSMSLSGAPLHVLAMTLFVRLGRDLGPEMPVSFSAGVTMANAADTVACGFVPVTSCTDLLRAPGYSRLGRQVRALDREMEERGVSSLSAFVFAHGHGTAAVDETFAALGIHASAERAALPEELVTLVRIAATAEGHDGDAVLARATRLAGLRNAADLLPRLESDARYRFTGRAGPRARAEAVGTWDCRNCDLCLQVCPNGALVPMSVTTAGGRPAQQIAVVADLCNDCGHCGGVCPDGGEPQLVKTRVFLSREAFEARPLRDGFFPDGDRIVVRCGGTLVDEADAESARGAAAVREGILESREPGYFTYARSAAGVAR